MNSLSYVGDVNSKLWPFINFRLQYCDEILTKGHCQWYQNSAYQLFRYNLCLLPSMENFLRNQPPLHIITCYQGWINQFKLNLKTPTYWLWQLISSAIMPTFQIFVSVFLGMITHNGCYQIIYCLVVQLWCKHLGDFDAGELIFILKSQIRQFIYGF